MIKFNCFPPKIVLASSNAGKVREISTKLAGLPTTVILQSALEIPDADETGKTFIENALIKARHASNLSGLPALADDSGLVVDALNGAPGVHSARYAGPERSQTACNDKLINAMQGIPPEQRTARYISVIAFLRETNDPTPIICQASWEGMILESPRGEQGFGYDPLFFLPDLDKSAAEIELVQKNQLSHRAKSLDLWIKAMQSSFTLS